MLTKQLRFFLAESYGHGLKARLRYKNKQFFFLRKVNIYTCSATNGSPLQRVWQEARWQAQQMPQQRSTARSPPQNGRLRNIGKLRAAIKMLSNKMEFDKWQQRLACSPLQQVWLEAKQQAMQPHSQGVVRSDKEGAG